MANDKFTDRISDIELANSSGDAQLSRITELFKYTHEGFAIMQKQINTIIVFGIQLLQSFYNHLQPQSIQFTS